MLRAVCVAVVSALFAAGANGQSLPLDVPAASNNSVRTLLDAMLGGSTERNGRSEEDERLDPDRPHFPEATTTVGIGRAILESGYTFTKKGGSFVSHSYPEALLRIGMLADWFEFRVGQNVVSQQESIPGAPANAIGAQDLYMGVKLAVGEQKGWLPAIVMIPDPADRQQERYRRPGPSWSKCRSQLGHH